MKRVLFENEYNELYEFEKGNEKKNLNKKW